MESWFVSKHYHLRKSPSSYRFTHQCCEILYGEVRYFVLLNGALVARMVPFLKFFTIFVYLSLKHSTRNMQHYNILYWWLQRKISRAIGDFLTNSTDFINYYYIDNNESADNFANYMELSSGPLLVFTSNNRRSQTVLKVYNYANKYSTLHYNPLELALSVHSV